MGTAGPPPNPDRDGDGTPDASDRCPDAAGPASTQGCPDEDEDTFADIDDSCPRYGNIQDPYGCPDEGASSGLSDFNGDGLGDIAGIYEYPGDRTSTHRIHLFAGHKTGIGGPSVFWQTDASWNGKQARFVSGFSAPLLTNAPPDEPIATPAPTPGQPQVPEADAARFSVRAKAIGKRSKLRINADPDQGKVVLSIMRKRESGWRLVVKRPAKRPTNTLILNLPKGRYRVLAESGGVSAVSNTVRLRR
jgi:hypothetical protein